MLCNPRHLVTALILIGATQAVSASETCSCIWRGDFAKAQQRADLVIHGAVVASRGNSIDLDVARVLRGKEFNPIIRVWGNNGKLCRPEVEQFPIGTEWMMALERIEEEVEGGFNPSTPNISYGRVGDYQLSSCAANWLKIEEGYATGNLIDGHRWQYQNDKMRPVMIEIVQAFIDGVLPREALQEAAKPDTKTRKLMNETRAFIRAQD